MLVLKTVGGALLALALLVAGGRSAWAHQDPPGCSGTAVDFSFTAYRANGDPIDLSETVSQCETITYQIVVGKSAIGNPCAFQGGTMTITTPDGVAHNVTPGGGVPCIGGTGVCANTTSASNTVNYTVSPADEMGGAVTAQANYTAALSHTGTTHTMGFPRATTTLPLEVMDCPPSTDCVDSFCDPNADSSSGALGICVTQNVPDSTPCTDNDGNQCTFAGCDGLGTCQQNHQVTVCPPDGNPCTNDLGCDSTTGACIYLPAPNSTPCPDSDGNLCTTAGCNGFGSCDQHHMVTVCPPDNNPCTNDLGCDSTTGACIFTPVPDSTPCPDTDNLSCTTAGCDAGVCNQTHVDTCSIDHFECYEVHRTKFTGPTVNLVDKFGSFTGVVIQRPDRLCNPADKNDEDNSAPTHPDHLVGYKVRYASSSHFNVQVTDQFGVHPLDVLKADRLLIPAAKSMSGPPPALTPPIIDHFTCYKVRKPKGTTSFTPRAVKIDDQFGTINITIKKPFRYCVPADKNLESPGAESHPQGLLCYKPSKALGLPPTEPTIRDQVGLRVLDLQDHREFCIPATDP